MLYFYLAGLTALLWSISGVMIKRVSHRLGNLHATALVGIGNVAILSIVVLFLGNLNISPLAAGLSIIGGIITGLGYMLFYKSLERQQVSNAYSTIEIQMVILFLYGVLVLGEAISPKDILGIIIIVLGTFAVTIEKKKFNRGLLPAIAAQAFWAFGWIFFVYPISVTQNHILPNLIGFVAVLTLACFMLLIYGCKPETEAKRNMKDAPIGITAGLFSGSGSAIYAMLIYFKDLALGAAISNTTPIIVAVISHFVYKERLSLLQVLGIIAVVLGAAMIEI